jgi:hypothetical protein
MKGFKFSRNSINSASSRSDSTNPICELFHNINKRIRTNCQEKNGEEADFSWQLAVSSKQQAEEGRIGLVMLDKTKYL